METVEENRRRLRRAKNSERRMGKWFIEHDGPDPVLKPGGGIVSQTGRVGHITALQFDILSRSYAGENKNMRVWAGLWNFWVKVVGAGIDFGKEPILRFEPTNEDPTQVRGRPVPNMHIITEERHAYLLRCERELLAIQSSPDVTVTPLRDGQLPAGLKRVPPLGYSKEQQVGRKKR